MSGSIVKAGSGVGPSGDVGTAPPLVTEAVGSIKAWPSVTPPATWMLMDYSAISRTLYPDLFKLIGTSFGPGDGATTFNLPDARGRFILNMGQSTANGSTLHNVGDALGEELHALITGELSSHSHSIAAGQFNHAHGTGDPTHAHNQTGTTQVLGGTGNTIWTETALAAGSPCNTDARATGVSVSANTLPAGTTAAAGSGTGHNTMPPFLCLVYIIKVSQGGGGTAQAPIADHTQPGLVNILSGNTTDYIGGDNACHPLPTLPVFYGTDTTNSGAYAVTVPSSFALIPGVSVYVTPTNYCTAGPTLSVNGTTAAPIVTKAGLALNAKEIIANKTFGVMYDGSNWEVFTPVGLVFNGLNVAGPFTIDCAGYDAVDVYSQQTVTGTGSCQFTLAHLSPGVPLTVCLYNGFTSAVNWYVNATLADGTAINSWWVFSNATTGATAVRCDSTALKSLTNAMNMMMNGMVVGQGGGGFALFLK